MTFIARPPPPRVGCEAGALRNRSATERLQTPRMPPRDGHSEGHERRGVRPMRERRYSDCPASLLLACAGLGAAEGSPLGAIVLRLCQTPSQWMQAAIQRAVVELPGVVSVTTNNDHVLINTRERRLATEDSFRTKVTDVIKSIWPALQDDQAITVVGTACAPEALGSTAARQQSFGSDSESLGHEGGLVAKRLSEREEVATEAPSFSSSSNSLANGEPLYLDEEASDGKADYGIPEDMQFSFFAMHNWMGSQLITEHEDEDSRMQSRLLSAKQRSATASEQKTAAGPLSKLMRSMSSKNVRMSAS
eukprot:TRINITY_DN44043_c0_g1_i1.p1 TRINITY_DN44043_c0_g1~~TRINITY_DN44043_c0_g1_i1.p1  ORF type:complete len:306 (-),score=47.15 TRINITY_DN44043_c0_g1_i1:84-1001(-)